MAQIVFPPNPNVGDTVTGEYGEVYTWDGQKWTITPGAGGGVAIEMGEDPPADPIPGNLWWSTGVSKLYLWDGAQWVVTVNTPEGGAGGGGGGGGPQTFQVTLTFDGQPQDNFSIVMPMAIACTLAPNLAGCFGWTMSPPLTGGDTTFTVQKIITAPTMQVIDLGTVTYPQSGYIGVCAGPGGSLAAGDILRFWAPSSPDQTMDGVSVTLLLTRT